MKRPTPPFERWLVFSDLDGTLLNHHDYAFEAALPVLRRLEKLNIPVILNTSKTLAEIRIWSERLENRHPCIVENGSAIIIPGGYFGDIELANRHDDPTLPGHDLLVPGQPIEALREQLERIRPSALDLTRCSLDQAMRLTGLPADDARLAQTRRYSIPLAFERAENEADFVEAAHAAGLRTLRGGRFLHLLGNCDKGSSLRILTGLYQASGPSPVGVVALGDSPNDLDMLLQADHAIVVNSPSSPTLQPGHPCCYRTRQAAPLGWVEGIKAFLTSPLHNHQFEESSYG